MNIVAGLETFLYIVSSALFLPVLVGLVFLIFWEIIYFGGFLREYLERRRGKSFPLMQYEKALADALKPTAGGAPLDHADIRMERRLQGAELELVRSVDRIRFAIRVGPALGLMGTLIPMGISLSALAQGDMPKMAGSMVTAFTAAVVGLACSVAAYLMSMAKEKWVRADMREMEYLTEFSLRQAHQPTEADRQQPEKEDEVSEKTPTL